MSTQHRHRVGDLVIMRNATYFGKWDGTVGLVVGHLNGRRCADLRTGGTLIAKSYKVRLFDGTIVAAGRYQVGPFLDSGTWKCRDLSEEYLQELAR